MPGPLLVCLALTAAPAILLPPWPLSPDGDLVAVRGETSLAAERARLEPVAPGLFRVLPEPGALDVRLRAGEVSASAPVEPPPGEIRISLRGPPPVKGRDGAVALEIEVPPRRPEGPPPVVVASSGRVRDLAPAGPGRFRATYEPSSASHPEVAVLVALSPRCPLCETPRAVGHAIVPLAAAIDLPGTSEPGARTTITIAGRRFGPATAGADGRFRLPVVVPPGAHHASAESVDAIGNRSRKRIDLGLPPVDRLACAAWPRVIPADGRSEATVFCVASSEDGRPEERAWIALSASAGSVSEATPFRGALQRATLRAPAGGVSREAVVAASYRDGAQGSTDTLRVGLATGAPAGIVARLEQEPVPLGAAVRAEAAVLDAHGAVVGHPSGPPGAERGFVAPDRFVAREEPGDLVQPAPLSFALAPGDEIASLALRREGPVWVAEARTVDARPAAGVPLRFGSGAEVITDGRGEARVPALGPRESVEAANGARAAGWEGIVPPRSPVEIARTVRVALRPVTAVDVVARVEEGMLRWRVERDGRALPERAVTLRAEGVALGPVERDAQGGRAAIHAGSGTVAVVDDATGVAAVLEVP